MVKDLPPAVLVTLSGALVIYFVYSANKWIQSVKDGFDRQDQYIAKTTIVISELRTMVKLHEQKLDRHGDDLEKHDRDLEELKRMVYPVSYRKRNS